MLKKKTAGIGQGSRRFNDDCKFFNPDESNEERMPLLKFDEQIEIRWPYALFPDYQEYAKQKRGIWQRKLPSIQEEQEIRNLIKELGI